MLASVPKTSAIPAFSRKYQTSCTTCHNNYPELNDFGEEGLDIPTGLSATLTLGLLQGYPSSDNIARRAVLELEGTNRTLLFQRVIRHSELLSA
jgi:hypothetical protein